MNPIFSNGAHQKGYLYRVRKNIFLLLIFSCALCVVRAQVHAPDSVRRAFAISANYSYEIPGGDLAKRFGNNMAIGSTFSYKTKKNFNYAAQWTYIFGKDVRENGILDSIMTQDGHIIDKEGKFADVRIFERGFSFNLNAGKIITVPTMLSPNRNSGIYLSGGIGILQHRIRIIDNGGRTPQLTKDYLKGYDRLTNGIAFNEFAGYWFMSKNHFSNFYAGFEITEAFTHSRRSWDYDLNRADTQHRFDMLWGGRLGWNILIAKRSTDKYYFN
ncbi:MAG: hypothetical protein HY064_17215 [Bacteroidetes bacterium]|nr:hypothetical protein [Bacteroidota bacterium]